MFRYEIHEVFGPFGGHGGYGSETRIGMDRRSPKRAVEKAIKGQFRKSENKDPQTGICGGGVPIMMRLTLYRGSVKLMDDWL